MRLGGCQSRSVRPLQAARARAPGRARGRRPGKATTTAALLALGLAAAGCGAPSAATHGGAAAASGSSGAQSGPACIPGQPSLQSVPTGATSMGGTQSPVQLIHGQTLAEVFTAQNSFSTVAAQSPTWFTTGSGYTLKLLQGAGLKGKTLNCTTFSNATDNQWNALNLTASAAAGTYTLTMSAPTGTAQEACPGHTSEPNCAGTPLSGPHGGVIGWYENTSGADSGDYAIINGKQTGGVFALFYQ